MKSRKTNLSNKKESVTEQSIPETKGDVFVEKVSEITSVDLVDGKADINASKNIANKKVNKGEGESYKEANNNDNNIDEQTEILDDEFASIKLEEAQKKVEPKKKKKGVIWNLVFLAINISFLCLVVRSLLKDATGATLSDVLAGQGSKLWWLSGSVVCLIGVYLCSAFALAVMVKNTTGQFRFWLCLKCCVLGKYYDFITPMAVGGQPSQILNLVKGGVKPGVATSIPIIKMIINQLVRWVLIILLFIFLVPQIPYDNSLFQFLMPLLKILSIIGIIATTVSCVSFLFMGTSKLLARTIARWTISIGYKLKIVKNYRASYDKFMRQVFEYQSSIRYLAKNKGVLFWQILLSAIEFFFYCSMAFFACMAFSTDITITSFTGLVWIWWIAIARYQIVDMSSTFIILPGGTGVKEIAFLIMFSSFFKTSPAVAWPFLAWRIFDYYIFLAIGFIVILTNMIIKFIKNPNEKKKNLVKENNANANLNKIDVEDGTSLQETKRN